MSHLDEVEEQLRRTNTFAVSLVGLLAQDTLECAQTSGYPVVVVRPPQYATTADLQPGRVRLRRDRTGRVDAAYAG